jgi:hypothetical protein
MSGKTAFRSLTTVSPMDVQAALAAPGQVLGSAPGEIYGWLGTYRERRRLADVKERQLVIAVASGTDLRANIRLPWLGD